METDCVRLWSGFEFLKVNNQAHVHCLRYEVFVICHRIHPSTRIDCIVFSILH